VCYLLFTSLCPDVNVTFWIDTLPQGHPGHDDIVARHLHSMATSLIIVISGPVYQNEIHFTVDRHWFRISNWINSNSAVYPGLASCLYILKVVVAVF